MTLKELQQGVKLLAPNDLALFIRWLGEYMADAWDLQIEADILAGRLDKSADLANADFDAGQCEPL